MINITHGDADGIGCLSLLYKKFGDKFKVYFSSPKLINRHLLRIIENNDKNDTVYITDIAINQEAIYLASYFKEVYWIDHHETNYEELTKRVKVYIKKESSATKVLSEYLDVKADYIDIIDKIDSNKIESDIEKNFRDLISAIRYFHPKSFDIYFISIAKSLARGYDIAKIINSNIELLQNFKKEIEKIFRDVDKRMYTINNKVAIISSDTNIPSSYYLEYIKRKLNVNYDYIIILYTKNKRAEIRTLNNKNVLDIAKMFNGGGHEYAAGFSYDNESEVIKKLELLFSIT